MFKRLLGLVKYGGERVLDIVVRELEARPKDTYIESLELWRLIELNHPHLGLKLRQIERALDELRRRRLVDIKVDQMNEVMEDRLQWRLKPPYESRHGQWPDSFR